MLIGSCGDIGKSGSSSQLILLKQLEIATRSGAPLSSRRKKRHEEDERREAI
jgi:hypothetical protein